VAGWQLQGRLLFSFNSWWWGASLAWADGPLGRTWIGCAGPLPLATGGHGRCLSEGPSWRSSLANIWLSFVWRLGLAWPPALQTQVKVSQRSRSSCTLGCSINELTASWCKDKEVGFNFLSIITAPEAHLASRWQSQLFF
jgi:hypothetical protein